MNARAVMSILLSLLVLLPSPSIQDDTSLWLGGSLLSNQYSASVNLPSLLSGSLSVPSVTVASVVNFPKWNKRNDFSGAATYNEMVGHGNEREPPSDKGTLELSNKNPIESNSNLFSNNGNNGNTERLTENGMYPHTSNERFSYQTAPINENTDRYDPGNRVPAQNEKPQNHQKCRDDEFRCGSSECLPYSVKCNNKVDCRDASDEAFCIAVRNQENGCVLPEKPAGGHYELGECSSPCNKRPGDIAPKNSILTYSCKNNYVLRGNTISVCVNNEWYKPPACVKICPALSSTSVDISCSYQGEAVSCSERILPGTRARLSCKSSYKLPLTNDPAYREITCLDDGLWDRRIFRCLPECGTSIANGNTLIVNGFEAKVGTFPWHVGIYRKKRDKVYEQICAGSLVSDSLVISAAHCFYDEGSNKLNDVSNYSVAGGKHYRDWDTDEQYCQKSPVEDIKLGGRYLGFRGNFAEDIALVKLKKPFELTALVRPICMDWDNVYEREQLQEGQSGKVAGWGKNIKGESTQTLYEIDMPYVPYHQCLSAVPMDFRGFITSDKFCAGRLNGSSVCEGDSGGGLCFEKNGVWYLRGIVSVSPAKGSSCDYNSYVGFTHIGHFRDWIREAYVSA
ncbi:modular serine protease-like isoform X2 [Odontomachus brunneus]|uniref:modular serine protease-like isoform X2 n=1 Tax=Odontomachus brunneus TaxID=486640 RepID=UPI0013F1F828|nr:modular serine protease-like isoform X2 [Odontomachus brunneus]